MKSWRDMFETSSGSFQRSWMEPQEVRITVKATTAVITCEEHVFTRRFVRGKERKTELVNKLQATNIFRKIGGKWYLSYHHADSEAAKVALKHSKGEDTSSQDSSDDEEPPAINNILGAKNVGPVLGDSKKGGESNGGPKKIVMGSLSDLLNGQLGDIVEGNISGDDGIMGGDDGNGGLPPGLEDMLGGLGANGPGKAIIQVHKVSGNPNGGDDENGGFPMNPMQQFTNDGSGSRKNLRKKCIEELRKLASDGRISQKQKRILLTDIIGCSSKGEDSMVEVAFELLCADSDGNEDAEEDFADQCRTLADQILY